MPNLLHFLPDLGAIYTFMKSTLGQFDEVQKKMLETSEEKF
jgi:hypothetical protein